MERFIDLVGEQMKIISLSGETKVGKNTFAEPLIKRGWVEVSFARNLKDLCKDVFKLTEYFVNHAEGKERVLNYPRELNPVTFAKVVGWMKKTHHLDDLEDTITQVRDEHVRYPYENTKEYKKFSRPRELLQFIGTDICRAIFPEYHMDIVATIIKNNPGSNIVITDARFHNERVMLKEDCNATLIRIKRPGYTPDDLINEKPTNTEPASLHVSETSLGNDSDYDVIIVNNGTVEELKEKALSLI
jgi:hypothetical protein